MTRDAEPAQRLRSSIINGLPPELQCGEADVLFAVLMHALEHFRAEAPDPAHIKNRAAREAVFKKWQSDKRSATRFFFNSPDSGVSRFEWICCELSIDPSAVRIALQSAGALEIDLAA